MALATRWCQRTGGRPEAAPGTAVQAQLSGSRLRTGSFPVVVAVLCIAGRLAASLARTHAMSAVSAALPSVTTKTVFRRCQVSSGGKNHRCSHSHCLGADQGHPPTERPCVPKPRLSCQPREPPSSRNRTRQSCPQATDRQTFETAGHQEPTKFIHPAGERCPGFHPGFAIY